VVITIRFIVLPLAFVPLIGAARQTPPPSAQPPTAPPAQLAPTVHPALPEDPSDLWLVPSERERAARTIGVYEPLADGVAKYRATDYAGALGLLGRPALAATPLAGYATYYVGLAELRMGRVADARRTFESLREKKPEGHLAIAAALAAGEAAEAAGDAAAAVRLYEPIAADKDAVNDEVLTRLGRAALAAGDRAKAAAAYVRLYYEFPLTDAATAAAPHISALQDVIVRTGYKADLGRAQILFGARRYDEARAVYQDLQRQAEGDDKELADLRLAECEFFLKRYAAARDGVRPYLDRASRRAEARFFYLSALRGLGEIDQYIGGTTSLVAEFPDSSWSEEALNNLASYYIISDQDALAAETFRAIVEKFPTGARAERAAWKYGWWMYRTGDDAETVRVFETAAATFPRSDYRPSYLYWAARAHERLGEATEANARLRLVFTDYGNSYYGRLAERQLGRRAGLSTAGDRAAHASRTTRPAPEIERVPTDRTIRLLLANGMYDDALNELRYAQRVWGGSPAIDATIAWVYHQQGELRRAITLMRRVYPQFLTGGGQALPPGILQVIFPLTYWDAIKRNSAKHHLDPYVVAALIAQESTFDAGVKSAANAWGLMQILPSTGRRLARTVGIRRFSTPMLTNPDVNIRLGTLYFSQLVKQFGGTYYALASYNAGESRIVRWKAERPGLEEDEFIDDIPFPETQNYVKRILGTAEDYRMLYGEGGGRPRVATRTAPVPVTKGPKAPVATKPATRKPATAKAPARKKPPAVTKKSTPSGKVSPKKKSVPKTSTAKKKSGG